MVPTCGSKFSEWASPPWTCATEDESGWHEKFGKIEIEGQLFLQQKILSVYNHVTNKRSDIMWLMELMSELSVSTKIKPPTNPLLEESSKKNHTRSICCIDHLVYHCSDSNKSQCYPSVNEGHQGRSTIDRSTFASAWKKPKKSKTFVIKLIRKQGTKLNKTLIKHEADLTYKGYENCPRNDNWSKICEIRYEQNWHLRNFKWISLKCG